RCCLLVIDNVVLHRTTETSSKGPEGKLARIGMQAFHTDSLRYLLKGDSNHVCPWQAAFLLRHLGINLNEAPLQPADVAYEIVSVSARSEEHTSELQSRENLVCRLLLEKKKNSHAINGEKISRSRSSLRQHT